MFHRYIILFLCACIISFDAEARIGQYITVGATLAAQLGCGYHAYHKGNYHLVRPLRDEHKNNLYQTSDKQLEEAVCRNTSSYMPYWLASRKYRQNKPSPERFDNLKRYIFHSFLATILPQCAIGGAILLPILYTTKTICAVKNISLLPLLIARNSCTLTLNAWLACSSPDTIQETLRPYQNKLYNALHTCVTQNPQIFDALVQSYCYYYKDNPQAIRGLAPQTLTKTPLRIGSYTSYIQPELFHKTVQAALGESIPPAHLYHYISYPRKEHPPQKENKPQQTRHAQVDDDIILSSC